MTPESSAFTLSDRVDALAEALRAAGVSPERSAGLLGAAATAAMHAVVLAAILDEPPPVRKPALVVELAGEQPVRLAA